MVAALNCEYFQKEELVNVHGKCVCARVCGVQIGSVGKKCPPLQTFTGRTSVFFAQQQICVVHEMRVHLVRGFTGFD